MIKCYAHIKKGETCHIKVCGHATKAPHGFDIVCAGISALVQALAIYVLKICPLAYVRIESGDAYIKADDKSGDIFKLFDMTFCGICEIQKQYPEYIKTLSLCPKQKN